MPLVSVIIPTYNRAPYIGRAISSVQSQLYKNIEIIVIDDGSTDNTHQVVQQFENVKYLYKENGRQASARNAGLKIAGGQFICTLDSDDYWRSNFLTESISTLLENDLDFVFANYLQQNLEGKIEQEEGMLNSFILMNEYFYSEKYSNQFWVLFEYEDIRRLFLKTCPGPSSGLVFNRRSIIGNWDERLRVADDWEFVIRLLVSKHCKTAFCKTPLWIKHTIGDNVFESLELSEVIKRVIVHDFKIILNNNLGYLTQREIVLLNQHRVNVCYAAFYRNLVIKRDFRESLIMLFLAFKCSPKMTMKRIYQINYIMVFKKINKKCLERIIEKIKNEFI